VSEPWFSVVVPSYNAEAYIGASVSSVLAQTYDRWDLTVVDDGSTDATLEAIRAFGDRVRLLKQKHAGPSEARNLAIRSSQGDWIAFLDSDDVWEPTKLARQAELVRQRPDVVLVGTDYSRSEHPGSSFRGELAGYPWRRGVPTVLGLLKGNYLHTSSLVVRRAALDRSGLFDPDIYGVEDLDLWVRLAELGSVECIEEVLVHVRRHQGQTTHSLKYHREMVRTFRRFLQKYGGDPKLAHLLRRRIGEMEWDLAYMEREAGHRSLARSAYLRSIPHGPRRWSAMVRAAVLLLPSAVTGDTKGNRNWVPQDSGAL
jgi:glycosyltransferase involved in cell wall biosynthesis